MSSQITAIIYVKVGGEELPVKDGSVTLKLGGKKRTPVMAGGRVAGYTEEVTPAELEFKLVHTPDVDLKAIADYVDQTVLVETDSGQTFSIAKAFTTEPPDLTGGSGESTVKMAGEPAEPI